MTDRNDLTQRVRDAIWTEIRRQADKPRSFSLTATNWVGLDKPGFIDGEVDLDLVARAAVEAILGSHVASVRDPYHSDPTDPT